MKLRTLCALTVTGAMLLACQALAGEEVTVDYTYEGDTGVSLASMFGGPISVSEFTDAREIADKQDIARPGKENVTLSGQMPAALIQQTFNQALAASEANLTDDEGNLRLQGELLEMQIEETADGLQVLIRCQLSLNNQGRNAWQASVFSRVDSEGDDISAAIGKGLDRLVSELFMDDYFLMELGIF